VTQNYCAFFGLNTQYSIELATLEDNFRRIQAEVHPDKFVTATSAEKLQSMQTATLANEAYLTLKSPALRAVYLLSLQGINAISETNTFMPADFLAAQMEWREQLEDAKQAHNVGALDELAKAIKTESKNLQAHFTNAFDDKENYQSATEIARKLTFIDKVLLDINKAIEQLD
jgi:molecular chaperone HscB